MPRPQLLTAQHLPSLEPFLGATGTVFRTFTDQDSGCVSYGVEIDGERFFVKTAATAGTVASLRRALAVHEVVAHPGLIPIVHSFTTDDGLALVYPWAEGEVLYHPTRARNGGRNHPNSAIARFRRLPLGEVLEALAVVLDVHLAVADADLVAVDFYDGCTLYDFATSTMRLCDLDEYRPGPFVLEADRLPGSTRYMAPEEFQRGAVIDQRTTVFSLGRTLRLLLDGGDAEQDWRGTAAQLAVIATATVPNPVDRYPSVRALAQEWRAAG
ncbi:serine/threonine protein kinase [Streptomyces sp. NPDC091273]|uniref:serine/threonine protein kinase n=1 Tax=Streptomyces sp. NPDC091273 TaxID=3365982 RepID=UPI0038287426